MGSSSDETAPPKRRQRQRAVPTQSIIAPKLGVRGEDEAAEIIGSKSLFRDMRTAGWVEPIYHSNNITIFDYSDLVRAFARLRAGEKPNSK